MLFGFQKITSILTRNMLKLIIDFTKVKERRAGEVSRRFD